MTSTLECVKEDLGSGPGTVVRENSLAPCGDDLFESLEEQNAKLQEMLEQHKSLLTKYRDEAIWAINLDEEIAEKDQWAASHHWDELMQCGDAIVNYAIKDWAILPGSGKFEYLGYTISRKPIPDAKSATMYRLEIQNNG